MRSGRSRRVPRSEVAALAGRLPRVVLAGSLRVPHGLRSEVAAVAAARWTVVPRVATAPGPAVPPRPSHGNRSADRKGLSKNVRAPGSWTLTTRRTRARAQRRSISTTSPPAVPTSRTTTSKPFAFSPAHARHPRVRGSGHRPVRFVDRAPSRRDRSPRSRICGFVLNLSHWGRLFPARPPRQTASSPAPPSPNVAAIAVAPLVFPCCRTHCEF